MGGIGKSEITVRGGMRNFARGWGIVSWFDGNLRKSSLDNSKVFQR